VNWVNNIPSLPSFSFRVFRLPPFLWGVLTSHCLRVFNCSPVAFQRETLALHSHLCFCVHVPELVSLFLNSCPPSLFAPSVSAPPQVEIYLVPPFFRTARKALTHSLQLAVFPAARKDITQSFETHLAGSSFFPHRPTLPFLLTR